MLKNGDRDWVPIPCPLTDSFEHGFRTDVVTCETRSSEFLWNLEVLEFGRSPSLRAPAAHGVSSLYEKYSTLANKWAFEQMGFSTENCLLTFREQMGFRTNGDSVPEIAKLSRKWGDFDKKLVKRLSFRDQKLTFM